MFGLGPRARINSLRLLGQTTACSRPGTWPPPRPALYCPLVGLAPSGRGPATGERSCGQWMASCGGWHWGAGLPACSVIRALAPGRGEGGAEGPDPSFWQGWERNTVWWRGVHVERAAQASALPDVLRLQM